MEKMKQRPIYFTDSEWDEVNKAFEKAGFRSANQFMRDSVLKPARKVNKK